MLPLIFLDSISTLPSAQNKAAIERGFMALKTKASQQNVTLAAFIERISNDSRGNALLSTIFSHSPFLTRLVLQFPEFLSDICTRGVEDCFEKLKKSLGAPYGSAAELMKALRIAKNKASLLIAIADITSVWPLEQVTTAMSEIAELCVQATLQLLLKEAARKKEITLASLEYPEVDCGLFVLAMGKLGARELNYSSDIDLIVFFDSSKVQYIGNHDSKHCFSKLTQEMVRLLQERTQDGYVFRVDLRLRPDPASTPVAMSTAGALTYYETVGQNWERAAFIKARPIAGDVKAGYQFLQQVAPFIWRKHLDFAAIADIQSIKRQMDAHTGATIDLPGHNVKTGLGGIREIEFFAQIHQLIWGGRMAQLRISDTCATLDALAELELITPETTQKLTQSYRFLRTVEHRLQMVDDQQTHNIPESKEGRQAIADFMGFASLTAFEEMLLSHLAFVHDNFAQSFQGQGSLGSDVGTLSFTGVENNPQTLETIRKMGYKNPASVSELIQSWHRGARRATRTKRARELITELTPALLKAFAKTIQPDQAFVHFDDFLAKLPAGVQLFSLFHANPHLLDLIATIMGSAPAMSESLSKNSNLLDTLLTADFFHEFPEQSELFSELSNLLLLARDFEDEMEVIRRFKNEKHFQAGVQLIRHQVTPHVVSRYLSDIADTCIQALLHRVEVNFSEKYPELSPGGLVVIALGRLGAQELTFGSDIDLVFVYDASTTLTTEHSLYNKLCQRFIGAITALTREGSLYRVDTRLRPSGRDGALAVSIDAFNKYFSESAWTFEFMALTRARMLSGKPTAQQRLQEVITRQIKRPREQQTLMNDIIDLRAKITKEFGSTNPWNIKYAHGGLMDLDFLAQYFVLMHAHAVPDIILSSTGAIFSALTSHGILERDIGQQLVEAHRFLNALLALIRLCGGGTFNEETIPQGVKVVVASSLHLPDFETVKSTLLETLATVRKYFQAYIKR